MVISENKLEDSVKKIDIDEISIAAGKEEAKYVQEKYTPTEEELQSIEKILREINESKFKILEEPVVEEVQVEEPILEEPVVEEVQVEEPIIEEPVVEEVQVEETVESTPTPVEKTINRLTYSSRNASNVSVQRI